MSSDRFVIASKVRLLVLILVSAVSFSLASAPEIKFYPFGELTLCKGCGHFKDDFWKLKFRLENRSGRDLTIYGRKFDSDDRFDFINQVQYRNPHTCEWQYGNGSSEKLLWKDRSSSEKSKIILKAGESIVSERGISLSGQSKTPTRFTTYIASDNESEPHEVFSDTYVEVPASGTGSKPSFRTIDQACSPQCTIGTENSPLIRGIRLGMTLGEFAGQFPQTQIHTLHKDKYNYKVAYLSDWNIDPYRVNITFINDYVGRIETQFQSLNKTRHRTDFHRLVADRIGLLYFGEPYRSGWECNDFIIDVIPNEDPTISIKSKTFIKVRDQINNDFIKSMK